MNIWDVFSSIYFLICSNFLLLFWLLLLEEKIQLTDNKWCDFFSTCSNEENLRWGIDNGQYHWTFPFTDHFLYSMHAYWTPFKIHAMKSLSWNKCLKWCYSVEVVSLVQYLWLNCKHSILLVFPIFFAFFVSFFLSTFLYNNNDVGKTCFIKFKLKLFDETTPLVSRIRSTPKQLT